jgi:hypothetical protein
MLEKSGHNCECCEQSLYWIEIRPGVKVEVCDNFACLWYRCPDPPGRKVQQKVKKVDKPVLASVIYTSPLKPGKELSCFASMPHHHRKPSKGQGINRELESILAVLSK